MSKRRIHFVLSTHWDREWRSAFQEMRYDMIRLFDKVLPALEDGRLHGPFTTDGQAVLLDDYLEIRPERRTQIEALLGAGKLVGGPWYTMPDEFAVSGESLIRNLRIGRDTVRAFGSEPSNAGYVCDMFGHNSQLPQIFAGFGIKGGLVWRGINNVETRSLLWRGADGTTLPCHKFPPQGYGDYSFKIRQGHLINKEGHDPQDFMSRLEKYVQRECEKTPVGPVLLLDGCDHQQWDETAYKLLLDFMAQSDSPCEFIHSDFDSYLAELFAVQDGLETVLQGELREPGRDTIAAAVNAYGLVVGETEGEADPLDTDMQWIIPGVLSSRVKLKQANRECETLLCHWAEPYAAFAHSALGFETPPGFFDLAWRNLLQNHPHDSIGGCSIDQVHRDMDSRFDQCRIIATKIVKEATRIIAANIEGEVTEGELRVVVLNPAPRDFDEIGELTLQIPPQWPDFTEFFGYESKPAFRIYTPDGVEVSYQRLSQSMGRMNSGIRPTKFPEGYTSNNITVTLPLSIPALGYTTLTVRAGKPGEMPRHPSVPGLATNARSMANEYLSVAIESNGTLTVTDKRNAQTYRELLTFEECADIGDGWFHGLAANDQTFVSSASRSDVALVHNGPFQTTFRIRTTMSVPRSFHFDSMTRSDHFTDMVIDSLVTLRPGQDYLDTHTTVNNTADNHRLRVLLPSDVQAETYLADSQFDVVERPIALRADNHTYRELELETKPQQSWTALQDEKRGLAVVANALLETAVRDVADKPIALTLFRGTNRTAFTNGEPDGQMRGRLEFDYRIVPLAEPLDRTRLCEMGQQISAKIRTAQLRPTDVSIYRLAGQSLPPAASFLHLEGPAVVSSIRQQGLAWEVRLWNPHDEAIEAKLGALVNGILSTIEEAQLVNFDGRVTDEPLTVENETVAFTLKPKQILTVSLR